MEKEQIHIVHSGQDGGSHAASANREFLVAERASVPKGYFYSPYFLGSMAAVGMSLMGSVGGFALVAPLLAIINADIGPNKNIAWVPLVFPVGLAVGQTLVGRLSDIFGRRYFLAGGQGLGVIGGIICGTAKNVPTLIGGSALVGLAGSTALSFPFIIGELVPMKYRFLGNAYANTWCIPFSGLAPVVANSLVARASWRWCYYIMIIFNGLSMLCYIIFYHPPTFQMKHSRKERLRLILGLDYLGLFLFIGGVVRKLEHPSFSLKDSLTIPIVFLLGVSWGGNVYAWKSAKVICAIVVGAMLIATFVLWEIYNPTNEPLVPMHLFKNRGWVLSSLLVSIGASVYYAFGIVWPEMVNLFYANGSDIYTGWLQCCVLGPFTLGEIVGCLIYKSTGNIRAHLTIALIIAMALLGAVAASTPESKTLTIGLLIPGTFFIGWLEALTFTLPGMYIQAQEEIGVAVGVAGSVRSTLSTIASTIYVAILTNRLATTVPAAVVPAVVLAGIPKSSIPSLLAALELQTPAAFSDVQGLTPRIEEIAVTAYKQGSMRAYRTVFLASLAFSGIGVLLSLFVPSIDSRMTDSIAVKIHKGKEEKGLENEAQAIFGTKGARETSNV